MKLSKTELQKKSQSIEDLINQIVCESDNISPITDGIIDIDKYYDAKYKILWILKEAYDDFDIDGQPCGGGWGLKKMINERAKIEEFKHGQKTFKPMIYSSWGILNDFCSWNNMDDVEKNPSMLKALKSIAYINVKKLPGFTVSSRSVISNAYQTYKEILLRQIEDYNPDVIIGGSTLQYFFDDLGFSKNDMTKFGSLNYIVKDDKIYISTYHPAQRSGTTGVSQEQYCDDIINVVKHFKQSK